MKRLQGLLFGLVIVGLGACHIISGGDEIVVAPEDDSDGPTSGSNTTVGGTGSDFPTSCGGGFTCDEFSCYCTRPFEWEGAPCDDGDPNSWCEDICCPSN